MITVDLPKLEQQTRQRATTCFDDLCGNNKGPLGIGQIFFGSITCSMVEEICSEGEDWQN